MTTNIHYSIDTAIRIKLMHAGNLKTHAGHVQEGFVTVFKQ